MENQDIDLIGQTVGNMPYKIGIVDQNGNLKNQFVANASTNRIDIPQSILGTGGSTGGNTGGNTGGGTAGGNTQNPVPQLPSTLNLFSGSAVGNVLLSGVTPNYDNVQDGLLITLSNQTGSIDIPGGEEGVPGSGNKLRIDLSSIGLKPIKIPKEQLTVGNSFDISDQLSQYFGKTVQGQYSNKDQGHDWTNVKSYYSFSIKSFEGTAINVLPNTTLSMNLVLRVTEEPSASGANAKFPIPVIMVNTYKN